MSYPVPVTGLVIFSDLAALTTKSENKKKRLFNVREDSDYLAAWLA